MKRMGMTALAIALALLALNAQAQWMPDQRLTQNSGKSYDPAIALDASGNIHVVWEDESPGNWEIYYTRSTDGGNTWTPSQQLTSTPGISGDTAIAVDSSGHLHVVWHDYTPGDYEIYYTKSTDGGATWAKGRRLTWNSGGSLNAVIGIDSFGHIHVVWCDITPGNQEIYYKKSTNGGDTWTPGRRLTWTSGNSIWPRIAVDSSDHLHVVWWDVTPGNYEVYYKKGTDGGAAWAKSQRLTWNSGSSEKPHIASESANDLYAVWGDNTIGNYEVYCRKSTDGGSTWTASRRLTWNSGSSAGPEIAVHSSGNLHIVWQDDTPGNPEIYYKKTTDGGAAWTDSQRLTWTSGESVVAALAVDPLGNIHIAWADNSWGNYEIYYKKGN